MRVASSCVIWKIVFVCTSTFTCYSASEVYHCWHRNFRAQKLFWLLNVSDLIRKENRSQRPHCG